MFFVAHTESGSNTSRAQPINHEQTLQTNHLLMARSSHEFLMAFVLFNSADQRGNPNKLEERMRGEKHSIILGNIILSDSQLTRIDEEGYQVKDKGKVRGEKCVVSL